MRTKINLLILLIIGLFLVYPICYKLSEEVVTITITDKERIVEGSGESISSKYLVFTESEVFENTDSILFFKFSSSDLQGRLKAGTTYKVKVAGWRIPFLSSYRNIIKVKKTYEH